MSKLFGIAAPPSAPQQATGGWIKDATMHTFMQDAIHASLQTPVLVDFWAPWCGPCKQLTPILEKCVNEAKGAVRLVKVNIDENPEIAQQLRIQSVPTVYVFRGGQPVDGFTGAQPESTIRRLVQALAAGQPPAAADDDNPLALAQELLEAGEYAQTQRIAAAIVAEEPENPAAHALLIRALLAAGKIKEAQQTLAQAPATLGNHADIAGARAALELASQTPPQRPLEALVAALDADPLDHAARFDLAATLFARGQPEAAIEELIRIVARERDWNDGAARARLLQCFDALGPTHPLTVSGRKKLSSVLFS